MYIHVTLYFLEFTYFASEANKLCKDTNDVPVLDMQTCAETIGYIDNVDSEFISSHEEFTVTSPSYPPGCYVRGPAHVFFNNHLDGKKAPNSRQVCENRGKTDMFGFELEGYFKQVDIIIYEQISTIDITACSKHTDCPNRPGWRVQICKNGKCTGNLLSTRKLF